MKRLLAYIFILIFSIQVLPVQEIGKMLFKNALTEEIHETEHDGDDVCNKLKKENDPFKPAKEYMRHHTWFLLPLNTLGISAPEHVSKQYIPDITTPPPNQA